jgi:hypothetical protein
MDFWIESADIDSLSNLLSSKDVDSNNTKLSSDVLFGRTAERIEALAHGDVAKTYSSQNID